MAYTYKDFLGAANNAKMLNRFSEDDLKITQGKPEYGLAMLGLYKDYDNAATPEAKLLTQAAMDQLRGGYGANTGSLGTTRMATPYDGNLMQPSSTKPGFTAVNLDGGTSTPSSVPSQGGAVTPSGGNAPQGGAAGNAQRPPSASFPSGGDQAYWESMDKVIDYGDFVYDRADQSDAALDAYLNRGDFTYANEEQRQAALNALLSQNGFAYSNEEQRQAAQNELLNYGDFAYDRAGQKDAMLDALLNQDPYAYGNSLALKDALLKATNPESFAYENEAAYQQLLQQAADREAFRYNPAADPNWQAYLKAFRREGDRATANALAQASAATGGVPSSYAVGAAQQAGGYYASKAADMLPTLYQQAYERYLNEQGLDMQALEALRADRSDKYGIHQDNYQKDLNAYELLSADERQEYERWVDEYERNLINYETLSADEQTKYQKYLDIYNMKAANLDVLNADKEAERQQWLDGVNLDAAKLDALYADKESARQQWMDGINLDAAQLDALRADEQAKYQKYLDEYEKYVTDHQLISADKEMSFDQWLVQEQMRLEAEAADKQNFDANSISEEELAYLSELHPTGVVTDQSEWDALLMVYTEEQLREAGLSFSEGGPGGPEEPPENKPEEPPEDEPVEMPKFTPPLVPETNGRPDQMAENAKITEQSIRDLGMGELTAEELEQLELAGVIERYVQDGVLRFRLASGDQEIDNPYLPVIGGVGRFPTAVAFGS